MAVEKAGIPIMLHTHRTNDVAQRLLEHKQIPGLKQAVIVKREAARGHHRFDFLLQQHNQRIYLEVKSCTLFSGTMAMFPDAVTESGINLGPSPWAPATKALNSWVIHLEKLCRRDVNITLSRSEGPKKQNCQSRVI